MNTHPSNISKVSLCHYRYTLDSSWDGWEMLLGWLEGSWGGWVCGAVDGWRVHGVGGSGVGGWRVHFVVVCVVVWVVGGFIGWMHILTHPLSYILKYLIYEH